MSSILEKQRMAKNHYRLMDVPGTKVMEALVAERRKQDAVAAIQQYDKEIFGDDV
jgi:hypothetical protein